MGDRTFVFLTVPIECRELAETVFDKDTIDEDWEVNGDLVYCGFNDVNYGDLGFLCDLADLGIPYESTWERGSEYGPGTEFGRFTPEGEYVTLTVYDSQASPDVTSLMSRIDRPNDLVQYIKDYVKEITPLPWDNQVEYGKIYRTKQLISA